MKPLNLDDVREYVNVNIEYFYQHQIASLEQLKLSHLLQRNPHLFMSRDVLRVGDLMKDLLMTFLASSEDQHFTSFLRGLALFVGSKACDAHKSAAPGVDLEFVNQGTHYIVCVKSGLNWETSSQHEKTVQDLDKTVIQAEQASEELKIQPVLGICYGKMFTTYTPDGYLKVVGQNFWHLISENESLYTEVVVPIGDRARKYDEAFDLKRACALNRFTKEFLETFCDDTNGTDWMKLLTFNSGNYDLEGFPQ